MSKKSRKARAKSHTTVKPQKKVAVKPVEAIKAKVETKSTVTSADISITTSQKDRYRYIIPELRRIAIIAVALIIIIIILTFVLG